MIATQLALQAPTRVERLILAASSPRFITGTGWPYAMDPAVLAGFARDLQEDYRGTLDRFLSLHVGLNTAAGRNTLRLLREMLFQFPSPAPQALRDGLAILSSGDLRPQLPALRCPVLFILGERDRLVPVGVGAALTALLPAARVQIVTGAGHAPFLSHQTEFLAAVSAFLVHAYD
jgi:pimeloyl-[acyl-carrier protein] methyl ester esterase